MARPFGATKVKGGPAKALAMRRRGMSMKAVMSELGISKSTLLQYQRRAKGAKR